MLTEGDERKRLFDAQAVLMPQFAEYEKSATETRPRDSGLPTRPQLVHDCGRAAGPDIHARRGAVSCLVARHRSCCLR